VVEQVVAARTLVDAAAEGASLDDAAAAVAPALSALS
jgi:hypothetical protein